MQADADGRASQPAVVVELSQAVSNTYPGQLGVDGCVKEVCGRAQHHEMCDGTSRAQQGSKHAAGG